MGKIILAVLICGTGVFTLVRPWIGINAYYLLAILGPQYIWWWNFEGLRVSFIVAVATIFGVGFYLTKSNHYDYNFLFNKKNAWLAVLWFCITCSYFFGPYVSQFTSEGLGPAQLFSITNTIFLFYFIAALELNDIKKLRYLLVIFVISTIYLTYWANLQYLTQNWEAFSYGRLMGPQSIDGGSIYRDENAFAMLFVCGAPFIYYFGYEMQKKLFRWGVWTIIPLTWHAIFLTGSRGGLVGLGATLICILFISNRKVLVIPFLVAFLFFYQWQAGSVMHERSEQIVGYEGEGSAEMRVAAWKGGMRMVLDQPLFGVGLGSFITALPDYYPTNPRVAHNTFVQFTAESGIGAGLAYLVVIFIFFKQSRRVRHWCRTVAPDKENKQIDLYNDASTASFTGLSVCALFLSLNTYEIFFVLLLFNNALYQIFSKKFTLNPAVSG